MVPGTGLRPVGPDRSINCSLPGMGSQEPAFGLELPSWRALDARRMPMLYPESSEKLSLKFYGVFVFFK